MENENKEKENKDGVTASRQEEISFATVGDRVVISGNTYRVRDALKASGARWDAERKEWSVAVSELQKTQEAVRQALQQPVDPDPYVVGSAVYKGRSYYVTRLWEKDGRSRAELLRGDGQRFIVSSGEGGAKVELFPDKQAIRRSEAMQQGKDQEPDPIIVSKVRWKDRSYYCAGYAESNGTLMADLVRRDGQRFSVPVLAEGETPQSGKERGQVIREYKEEEGRPPWRLSDFLRYEAQARESREAQGEASEEGEGEEDDREDNGHGL